jgi:DNA-directed RNA polymerase
MLMRAVERKRKEDAAAGQEEAQVLEGFIKRKVVKQTVMTTVYGVTKFGASKQIARQLKDIE